MSARPLRLPMSMISRPLDQVVLGVGVPEIGILTLMVSPRQKRRPFLSEKSTCGAAGRERERERDARKKYYKCVNIRKKRNPIQDSWP